MIESFLKYLTYEKRYSKHTITSYRNDLDQFRAFLFENYDERDLAKTNHAIIRDWMISLGDKGLSNRSINRKIISVRSLFKFLYRRGFVESNPTVRIKALKTPKNLPHFVREQDMDLLLDQGIFDNDFSGLRDLLVLELLYGTGMRLSELIEIKVSDVRFKERTIKVLGKRNKERIIPIAKSLENLIKNYVELKNQTFGPNNVSFLIVTSKGDKAYPMFINRIVKKYLGATSVDKKSPHILRHTYATHLLNRGADLNAVKDLLGHQSLAATQVYTHNTLGKLKKVFDQAHPKA
jgi:integrase/recombinase XerC